MAERTSFLLILVLWGAGLGAAGQYAKISVIFDQLPSVYPQAGASLGFVVSLVGLVGIVFGVVAGLIVARIRYRRALLWALWVGAGMSLIQAFLPPLFWMLLTRLIEGLSHLAIVVAAPTLIAQLSAERHRGLTLTLWSTFFGVAFALLVAFGLPLVEARGISALFLAHGIWMALFATILGVTLHPQHAPVETELSLHALWWDHIAIYRSPDTAAPGVGWLFYTLCFLGILTVLPPYIPVDWRVWVLGAMPLMSIFVSMTFGVVALRYISAVKLIQSGFLASIGAMVWLLVVPGGPFACLALAATLGLVQGATFAAVPQLNHGAAKQAQAYGAMAQTGNLGNTLGTPILLAVLGMAGYAGLVWTVMALLLMGWAVHTVMHARRS